MGILDNLSFESRTKGMSAFLNAILEFSMNVKYVTLSQFYEAQDSALYVKITGNYDDSPAVYFKIR